MPRGWPIAVLFPVVLMLNWLGRAERLFRQRVDGATTSAATALDFREMSARNSEFPTQNIVVANGSSFVALKLTREQLKNASNLLYMHFRRDNRRCYVGITVLPVLKRWRYGFG